MLHNIEKDVQWDILTYIVYCIKSVGGLTPLGSNFYYDNAFTYIVYWTVFRNFGHGLKDLIQKCIIIVKITSKGC